MPRSSVVAIAVKKIRGLTLYAGTTATVMTTEDKGAAVGGSEIRERKERHN
jgi:hypothetical protein